MSHIHQQLIRWHAFWSDQRGQDLIEYALITAMIAIVVAGFLPPNVVPAISAIFSKINSGMAAS
jgi:Flp pilus assembly pilin Flp